MSASSAARFASLDGLRGAAAFVVVLHHVLLTWPVLANQFAVPNEASATWWLTFTPLHLVWAGGEAVVVFFVLSGFVLTRSALGLRGAGLTRWRGYYAARLVRLYVPVWASLVLAVVLVQLFPRTPRADSSWWFNAHDVAVDPHAVATDALLVTGVGWIHPTLWSLRFEVLFSLALPVFVWLVVRGRTPWWARAGGFLVLAGAAQVVAADVLSWLAVFGVGAALAVGWPTLAPVLARLDRGFGAAVVWWAVAVAATVLLLAEWWVRGAGLVLQDWMPLVRPAVTAGALLVVLAALGCRPVRRVLVTPALQWAGRISFSLYLVHEPVVVSVASVVGGSRSGLLVTATAGVGAAVLAAVLFHRWVEAPAQRWARRVARPARVRRTDPATVEIEAVRPLVRAA